MTENQDTREMIMGATIVEAGFEELDTLIAGLRPNELTILAARPGVGKTALALTIAENIAVKDRQTVLFVSLAMAKLELSLRLICSRAKLDAHEMRSGSFSKEEQDRFVNVCGEWEKALLYVDDAPRSVAEISTVAQRLKQEKDLKLIVIDHIGLIAPENPDEPREKQLTSIAQRLKELAEELHVSVLCLTKG